MGPEGPRGGHAVAPVGGGGGRSGGGEEWSVSSIFCRKSQAYFPSRCRTGKKEEWKKPPGPSLSWEWMEWHPHEDVS